MTLAANQTVWNWKVSDRTAIRHRCGAITEGLLQLLWKQMSVNSISNSLWITLTHTLLQAQKHTPTNCREEPQDFTLKHTFPLLLRILLALTCFHGCGTHWEVIIGKQSHELLVHNGPVSVRWATTIISCSVEDVVLPGGVMVMNTENPRGLSAAVHQPVTTGHSARAALISITHTWTHTSRSQRIFSRGEKRGFSGFLAARLCL